MAGISVKKKVTRKSPRPVTAAVVEAVAASAPKLLPRISLDAPIEDLQKYVDKFVRFIGCRSAYVPKWGTTHNITEGQVGYLGSISHHLHSTIYVHIGAIPYAGNYVLVKKGTFIEEVEVTAEMEEQRMRERFRSARYSDNIGTDPEVFVLDGKGSLMAAFDFLPQRRGKEITPYWDGYQAEFGTQPTTCLDAQTGEVKNGLARLLVEARKKDSKATLSTISTMDISEERLRSDKQEFVNFGCTPSLSLYGETFPPVDPRSVPFRSAGGHMHFSYQGDEKLAVAELDRILSVIGVSLFQHYDDPRRRVMYGRAGEYRKTGYGFEYRVPSMAWLIHPSVMNFQFELARRILGQTHNNKRPITSWVASAEEVRECINNCDVALAHKIMTRNGLVLRALLAALPGQCTQPDMESKRIAAMERLVYEGVHTVLATPDAFSEAWGLLTGNYRDGTFPISNCGMFTRHLATNPGDKIP